MGEPPSTLTSPDTPRRELTSSRPDARSSPSSPVEPAESLVARLDTLMTSPTSTVLDTLRSSWSRSRLTLSTPSGRKMLSSRRSTACKSIHHDQADNYLFSDSLGLTFWTQLLKLSNFWAPNLTRNSFHF